MLTLTLDDGSVVLVEALTASRVPVTAAKGKRTADDVQEALERSIGLIGTLAQKLRQGMQSRMTGSFDAELQFGISFTAEADLVLVKGTTEATATVTVKWSNDA